MKNVKFKHISIQNFKGIKSFETDLTEKVTIAGKNGSGKSTVYDAITWLLFNKNSSNIEKFGIRRVLPDGELEHNTEIAVELTIDVDGKTSVLKKVQKENWVKHRGSTNPTLEGNPNSYEIDGFPVPTERKWKEEIANIIDEDKFKLLCNPMHFNSLKWKEQREIIMSLVGDITDEDIIANNPSYAIFKEDLANGHTVDEIRTKFSSQKRELNQKLKEIPARIDELNSHRTENIDASVLIRRKAELEELIKTSTPAKDTVLEELIAAKQDAYKAYNEAESRENQKYKELKTEYDRTLIDLSTKSSKLGNEIAQLGSDIEQAEKSIETSKADRASMGEKYKEGMAKEFSMPEPTFREEDWVFDESTTICPLCHQKLPDEKIAALHSTFEMQKAEAKAKSDEFIANAEKQFNADKAKYLADLMEDATAIKKREAELSKKIEEKKLKREALEKELEKVKADIEEHEKHQPVCSNSESEALWAKVESLAKEIEERRALQTADSSKDEYLSELHQIDTTLANVESNKRIQERINDLETEQGEVAQKVSEVEGFLFLLDEFMTTKLNAISDAVNSKFHDVNFKLFNIQVNGGVAETCESTINGVPYSDLNSGHRIVAGLEIIKTLQQHYEVTAPIVIDNAETINNFNIPTLGCQLIKLSVSESDLEVKEN